MSSKPHWVAALIAAIVCSAAGQNQFIIALDRSATDGDLENLKPDVVVLRLINCEKVTAAGLAHLKKLPGLVDLTVEGFNIDDDGFKHIGSLTLLKGLSISTNSLTDARLKHLSKFVRLRSLSLTSDALTDAGLEAISGHKTLAALYLHGKFTAAAMEHVQGLSNLDTLGGISFLSHTDKSLGQIAQLPMLTELMIFGQDVTDAGVAQVAQLKKLERLELWGLPKVTDAALAKVAAMPSVKEIRLRDCGEITDAGMAMLANAPALRRLELSLLHPDEVTGAGVAALSQVAELEWNDPTNMQIQALAAMPGLRSLTVGRTRRSGSEAEVYPTRLKNQALVAIAQMPSLESLTIYGSRITSVEALAAAPRLKRLALIHSPLADAASLGKLTRLEFLNISYTPITDLSALAPLVNLQTLWLKGTKITDADLEHLKPLPKLRELNVTGSKATAEAATEVPESK